jgi:WhiB family redox-sensing transcriptional regulator
MERAACSPYPSDYWYPELDEHNPPEVRARNEARGKAICRVCPVRAACLQYATNLNIKYGTFGGQTAKERRQHAASTS